MYLSGLRRRTRDYRCHKLMNHIHALCNHDKAASDLLLDWMAHMILHPTIKPSKGIFLSGPQCSGKSTFKEMVSRLVPTCHIRPIGCGSREFEPVLVVATEFQPSDAKWEQLKSLVAEQTLTVQKIHTPPRVIHSAKRVLVLARDTVAAPSSHFHICSGSDESHDAVYWSALWNDINSPTVIDALRGLLMARSPPIKL